MIDCSLSPRLSQSKFREYRLEAIFKGNKWDPQLLDFSVIGDRAILIGKKDWNLIQSAAVDLFQETLEIEKEVQKYIRDKKNKRILPSRAHYYSNLLPLSRTPDSVRLMRFDFHPTEEGWRLSEVNSDVPGGLNEASVFQKIWPERPSHWNCLGNPADQYISTIAERFELSNSSLVGLLHATSFSDDWQFMSFLQKILSDRGIESIGLSPVHIDLGSGRSLLNHRKLDVILRFFPGDWLLFSKLGKKWFEHSPENLINPLHSIYSQYKYFPVILDNMRTQFPTWYQHLPKTKKIQLIDLLYSDDLIKPTFGRVGEDIHQIETLSLVKKIKLAIKVSLSDGLWIQQKKFKPLNLGNDREPMIVCVGVYCLNGEVIGAYGRVSRDSIVGITATENPIFLLN